MEPILILFGLVVLFILLIFAVDIILTLLSIIVGWVIDQDEEVEDSDLEQQQLSGYLEERILERARFPEPPREDENDSEKLLIQLENEITNPAEEMKKSEEEIQQGREDFDIICLTLQQQIDDYETILNCGICTANRRNIVFTCGHTSCSECAVRLIPRICPICRKDIELFHLHL